MKNNIFLSVIVPVNNSESFLLRSLNEIEKFLIGQGFYSELLIIDDGSSDKSLAIAKEWSSLQKPFPVTVISLEKKMGKGAAVAKGMLTSRGEYKIFLDSDLAYEPSQILRILKALSDDNDIVIACRAHPDSRYKISPINIHYLYTRHLESRLINWFLRHTIIPHCSDSQAGLKGFKAQVSKKIFSQQIIKGFSFDIETLYLAEQMNLSIKEVPVDYQNIDEPTTVVFLLDAVGIVRDIIKIRLHKLKGGYRLLFNSDEKAICDS